MGDDGGFAIFVLMLIGAAFLCLLSYSGGVDSGIKKMQVEAVRNGYGEYEVDEHGTSTFHWVD